MFNLFKNTKRNRDSLKDVELQLKVNEVAKRIELKILYVQGRSEYNGRLREKRQARGRIRSEVAVCVVIGECWVIDVCRLPPDTNK